MAVSAVDGEISPVEARRLETLLHQVHLFETVSEADFQAMLDKLRLYLEKYGPEQFSSMCLRHLNPKVHEPAFVMACDMILADAVITAPEQNLIHTLEDRLKIDHALALKIVEVILIKNRG